MGVRRLGPGPSDLPGNAAESLGGEALAPLPLEVRPTPRPDGVRADRSPRTEPPTDRTFTTADLRTVSLAGHRGCGKTSLAETLLQAARVVREVGSVDAGTTLLNHGPESRSRRQTLELATAWLEWGDAMVQLLDTPGTSSLSEVRDLGIRSSEVLLVAVDVAAGVQVGTEDAVRTARGSGIPVVAVITKLDRAPRGERTFDDLADRIGALTGVRAVPVHLPFLDAEGQLVGLIDLVDRTALRFADDGSGLFSPEPVPEELRAEVAAAHERLAEAIAVTDDRLLEEYLEYLALPPEALRPALAAAVARGQLVPIVLTSAERRIGSRQLLDAMVAWTPLYGSVPRELVEHDGTRTPLAASGPFVAQVLSEHRDEKGETWHLVRILAGTPPKVDWVDGRTGTIYRIRKTYRVRGPRRATAPSLVPGALIGTWDPLSVQAGTTLTQGTRWEIAIPPPRPAMMAFSVRAIRERDEGRLQEALAAVIRADRGLSLRSDTASGALLLAGQDEAHVRQALDRLRGWSGGIEVEFGLPPVGYVETPTGRVHGVEGLHVAKDGDGLVEEFGKCEVALVPTSPADGASFVDALGDEEEDLPRRYRWAVDQGVRDAMRHGPTAGYPVVGAELRLTGGAYDILQSTDDHFRQAGEKATRIALERAGTRLLEPWCDVEVTAPNQAVGDLISDIAAHRGRVVGMSVDGERAVLQAHCPYRELRTYASRLRTLTSGRGVFRSEPSHYEPLPDHLLSEAIASSPHKREGGRDGRDGARPTRVAGR